MKGIYKKLLLFLLAITFFIFSGKTFNVYASEKDKKFSSKASFLMDVNSGTIISAKNENERLPIASMVKIMLLLLSYENVESGNVSLKEEVIVSKNASSMGGSQVFLEEGGSYKVADLLKSITIASANDASIAIAERLYGSEEECVNEMNKKAQSLNLKNTLFCNATGLPKPMQYSSAKDISLIFKELIKYKNYFEFSNIWMDKINHKENYTEISNTNKLVKFYEGCDGGKTGFTNDAGFCLTATAKRGNMRLISCVIGAESSKERFNEASTLFNYGFNNYCNKCVVDSSMPINEKLQVKNSKEKFIEVIPESNFYVFSKRNSKDKVESSIEFFEVKVPINKGQVVGKITIFNNGVEVGKVNLLSTIDACKMSYFDNAKEILENF